MRAPASRRPWILLAIVVPLVAAGTFLLASPKLPGQRQPAELSYDGNCPSVIEGRTFRDLGADVIAIRVANCTDVTIRNNDFVNVSQGIYAINSSNITIVDNRYQNITGPYERIGLNRGNFVQFDKVNGGLIGRNAGRCGDTEDIISLYKTSNVVVEDNHFEGVYAGTSDCLAWRSEFGSGIMLGDSGGSYNTARRNVLVNVGQVGIGLSGGVGNRAEHNTIYIAPRSKPNSNVGIYVWRWNESGTCSGHAVINNKVQAKKADGTASGYWDGGNCGPVDLSGNEFNAALDVNTLLVTP